MKLSRRQFLKLAGTGLAVAVIAPKSLRGRGARYIYRKDATITAADIRSLATAANAQPEYALILPKGSVSPELLQDGVWGVRIIEYAKAGMMEEW